MLIVLAFIELVLVVLSTSTEDLVGGGINTRAPKILGMFASLVVKF